MDDLFDGWLDVPSMTGFLVKKSPEHRVKRPNQQIELHPEESPGANQALPILNNETGNQSHIALTPTNNRLPHRKTRTKSRLGCITCKKRKCSETWPSCTNCIRRGAVCRYPSLFEDALNIYIRSDIASPSPIIGLSNTPNTFSGNDLRMFHHYLAAASPYMTLGNEDLWVKELPVFSHQYSYLMHAILSIAGLHMAFQTENFDIKSTILHRQKAIRGVNESLAKWPLPAEEANIILATSFLLFFQCSFIEDGFMEFYLSLRGCALLTQLIQSEGLAGPLTIQADIQSVFTVPTFQDFPQLDQEITCSALRSLRDFSHLLAPPTTPSLEQAIVTSLVASIQPLLVSGTDTSTVPNHISSNPLSSMTTNNRSQGKNPFLLTTLDLDLDTVDWDNITNPRLRSPDPLQALNALISCVHILCSSPLDALMHLFDPTNQLGNIVTLHFLAVRFILSALVVAQTRANAPVRGLVKWTERILDAIEDEDEVKWTQYIKWPTRILKCMQACVRKKRGFTIGDVNDMLINDPGALREGRARL
ncbi:hypothetical protein GQ44DRAFT_768408 [Phaeosphaeriaceae sp. PMI808]|nr:hypothetical protein GQ44DRAFT_768408 [Phaeosphaeriaceae sp. PMI808]